MLWFSAPTRLNETLERIKSLKILKYHEAVNMANIEAIFRDLLEVKRTPRSCMLASVATILHKTHRKWGVNKQMEGWMKRGSCGPLPSDDDDSDDSSDE